MSNKEFSSLNPLDKQLRALFPVEINRNIHTQLIIKKICGFELFNTRPYHNYETWSDGYVAEIDGKEICKSEDLDDLIAMLERYKCVKCGKFHSQRRECEVKT